ncbi:MAG: hypothetical protein KGO94_06325 [Alphaproteobacteria bacterium]|nr:hypothetical protein [Alphaproteobacteria bacterium]
MSNTTITIRPVLTKADKLTFLKVPFEIYAQDKNWVAPLFLERLEHLDPKKNPYFEHAEAQLFIAEKNGKAVGRISAQIDRLYLDRYNDACGQFGFVEAVDDQQVFAALIKAAKDWLRAKGMAKMRGPFSFSINDESGLLIDGFDTPPNSFMGHAQPYYQTRMEDAGLHKAKDLHAYIRDMRLPLPAVLERIYQRGNASGHVTIRPMNKADIQNDIKIVIDIFNDAWSSNWGYVPFTEAELAMLAKNLKMLVHKNAVQIAYYKGEPAAFIISMPNLNEWFAGLNGRLLPRGLLRMIGKLITKKSKSIRVPLMGVRRHLQDGTLGSVLSIGVIKTVYEFHKARGVEEVEMSWILEDNTRMRHILEASGSRIYKNYRVYEAAL